MISRPSSEHCLVWSVVWEDTISMHIPLEAIAIWPMVNLCYLTGGLFDNSCLAEHSTNIQKIRSLFWILFIQLIEFYNAVAVWAAGVNMHINTCSRAHELKHKPRRLLINFCAGREGCGLWGSGEGLMGSREVQARWLKTQATDVSGTLQSGAPASASAGHDALLRWRPPGTWRWHHMPGPPGIARSRGGAHFGSQLPSSQSDEGHRGKRHTCSTRTSKALNWGMCSL